MNDSSGETVAIVGGGITGLEAARRLQKLRPDARVIVLERDERLGGKILTHEIAGVPVEAGADWFITRQPAALELVRELALDEHLVTPERGGAFVWTRGKLRKLTPDLVRGIPTRPFAAARAGLLSSRGALRASFDLLSRRPLSGPDVSVGQLVRTRMGDEVMERLVDPMLAASRSGSADDMSLATAAPEVDVAARSHRSLMMGLRQTNRTTPSLPPFFGLRGGMSRLVDAIVGDLDGAEVRLGAQVTSLRVQDGRYALTVNDADDVQADAVILAVPAFAAAELLRPIDEGLASDLALIEYAPATVLTLVYPAGAGDPPAEGSGMLVPSSEDRLLTALAWFSKKWAHAQPADGSLVLRCFVGRADAMSMEDDDLVALVTREVRQALHLAGPPSDWKVTRWSEALPVYRVGHLDLLDRIERRVAARPGLELAGAGYRGSGLPDCISQGRSAGEAVATFLATHDGRGATLERETTERTVHD